MVGIDRIQISEHNYAFDGLQEIDIFNALARNPYTEPFISASEWKSAIRQAHKRLHPDRMQGVADPPKVEYTNITNLLKDTGLLNDTQLIRLLANINERGKDGWESTWSLSDDRGNWNPVNGYPPTAPTHQATNKAPLANGGDDDEEQDDSEAVGDGDEQDDSEVVSNEDGDDDSSEYGSDPDSSRLAAITHYIASKRKAMGARQTPVALIRKPREAGDRGRRAKYVVVATAKTALRLTILNIDVNCRPLRKFGPSSSISRADLDMHGCYFDEWAGLDTSTMLSRLRKQNGGD
ncbi:hypothetical protein NX059_004050 [Plenodomus lindquistii]|nr:hypothetical protein NX059_004050 [Plenodomus lindquistii]